MLVASKDTLMAKNSIPLIRTNIDSVEFARKKLKNNKKKKTLLCFHEKYKRYPMTKIKVSPPTSPLTLKYSRYWLCALYLFSAATWKPYLQYLVSLKASFLPKPTPKIGYSLNNSQDTIFRLNRRSFPIRSMIWPGVGGNLDNFLFVQRSGQGVNLDYFRFVR